MTMENKEPTIKNKLTTKLKIKLINISYKFILQDTPKGKININRINRVISLKIISI